jgi:hypothetical protein
MEEEAVKENVLMTPEILKSFKNYVESEKKTQ